MTLLSFRWGVDASPLAAQLSFITAELETLKGLLMATKSEFAASLNVVTTQVEKIGSETRTLLDRIADLTAAVEAAGNSSPEMDAALAALQAQVAVVDGLVPDA